MHFLHFNALKENSKRRVGTHPCFICNDAVTLVSPFGKVILAKINFKKARALFREPSDVPGLLLGTRHPQGNHPNAKTCFSALLSIFPNQGFSTGGNLVPSR